ncbi:hypothetical protein acsn021_10730 [Anaerocolumna cellulosilytica]|uniref:Peptidase S41 n=1 Tax=Anaerocolumna cellulosilytica TaxID=433286 RepID=A0A6S6QSB3_9FIRM|nr:S41 family peptidase [Anaerocolumna cellulosilytica]MBB5194560.1 hypothetical protein [Anaerocolumna cellulosilytica]BCJ93504.1 hypothetical protein acsn021_10730 [Anaerocolumna cellulosilytica]
MKVIKPFIVIGTLFILSTAVLGGCKLFTPVTSQNTTIESNSKNSTGISQSNRDIILQNDYTSDKRNLLLKEDIVFLTEQLTKKHKNPYHNITKKEFESNVHSIMNQVDTKDNSAIFVELQKLVASIGDAHTTINTWDGYTYPMDFYYLDGGIYVINADTNLADIIFSKVSRINGTDINEIIPKLSALIPSENEQWKLYNLPGYLKSPGYLLGLGLIPDEHSTVFDFETGDDHGTIITARINTLSYGESPNYYLTYDTDRNVYFYDYSNEDYYWYNLLEEDKTLYFKYNVCTNMEPMNFQEFNKKMWQSTVSKKVSKIIIDLRNNTGGNSTVINPFLKSLNNFIKEYPDTSVYVIIGRETFSSGLMAVLDLKKTVPGAVLIGESTGGSPNSYGEVKHFNLPNSQLPVTYSVKYFKLTEDDAKTIQPDIVLKPDIQDFKLNKDVIIDYLLNQN